MDSAGNPSMKSSSSIVPDPVSSSSPAPAGSLNVTVKLSSDSTISSCRVTTSTVRCIVPGGKVSVPPAST